MKKTDIPHVESGAYTITGSPVKLSTNQIHEAVEADSRIPSDVKEAVKDFLQDAG